RLRLGLERPDLEAELERAGRRALSAEAKGLDEVRAAFERVLAFDTHIWEAYFGLGLVARRSDDFAAAAGSFRRALELAPEQADVMHELGVALLASGSRADALGLLDRAASLRPREAAYIADAGFAHLQAGDLGAARERLRMPWPTRCATRRRRPDSSSCRARSRRSISSAGESARPTARFRTTTS